MPDGAFVGEIEGAADGVEVGDVEGSDVGGDVGAEVGAGAQRNSLHISDSQFDHVLQLVLTSQAWQVGPPQSTSVSSPSFTPFPHSTTVGEFVGVMLGAIEGAEEGSLVRIVDGAVDGLSVRAEGALLGAIEGDVDGELVGVSVSGCVADRKQA